MGKVARRKKRKRELRLPNRLLALKNADKAFHESWHPKRNLLNFPHPFRAVLLGPPNTGKSATVKNLLLRAKGNSVNFALFPHPRHYRHESTFF